MAWLISFVAGIVLTIVLPLPDWRLPLGVAALLWPWRAYLPARRVVSVLAGLALGFGWACSRIEQRQAGLLPVAWEGRAIEFDGVVRGVPRTAPGGARVLMQVERVLTRGASLPPQLSLRTREMWPAASRWRVRARFVGARATANRFGFDGERWMWANDVLASGVPLAPARSLGMARDAQARVDRVRAAVVDRLRDVLGPTREAGLLAALTVGVQHDIPRRDWQLFARTGVTHLVAISGLHIGIVAGLAGGLARVLIKYRPPRRIAAGVLAVWISLAAAAVYATLAGLSVPTRRTLCTLAALALMLQLRRAFSPFRLWWSALATVLAFDPFAVLAPGLWLSFGMVAALLIVAGGRRSPPGKAGAVLLAQWGTGVLSLLPLLLFFGSLPLLSPLANLVAIPYVSLLLTPLALLAVALPLDALLHVAAWLATRLFDGLALLADGPQWVVPGLPWPVWLAGAVATLWLIAPRGVPGRGLALLLLAPVLLYRPPAPQTGAFRLAVFDVGHGVAVLVSTSRHHLLFGSGALPADAVLLPQLAGLGVERLDLAVLPDRGQDYDGAAPDVFLRVPVAAVLAGETESWPGASPCLDGMRWQWDGVRFAVRVPTGGRSCVLKIAGREHSALLTGDLSAAAERELTRQPGLAASVLLAPRHGGRGASSEAFLAAVAPRWVVISAGYRNRFGQPHPDTLRRYRERGSTVLRTDRDGAIVLDAGRELTVGIARGEPRPYWRAPPSLH